jgi:hypothetical protein
MVSNVGSRRVLVGAYKATKPFNSGYQQTPIQRGDNAHIYDMFFLYAPVWLSFLIMTTSLLLIYCRIRESNLATARYHREGGQQIQRRFATQATLYVLAWFLSWSVMSSIHVRALNTHDHNFWHAFAGMTLLPLQGFWNMLVFKYPEYLAWRDQKKREASESSGEGNTSNETRISSIFQRLPFRRECFEESVAREVKGRVKGEECQEENEMLGSSRENTSEPNAREAEEIIGLEWVSETSTEDVIYA